MRVSRQRIRALETLPQRWSHLTLPYRASLSLLRRGKDFSVAKSEGEVKGEMCVHRRLAKGSQCVAEPVLQEGFPP
jgi:hypothetical protein